MGIDVFCRGWMDILETQINQFRNNSQYELEMCLRPKTGNATLSEEVYDLIKTVLNRSAEEKLFEAKPIEKYWDFFYDDSVRMRCRLAQNPDVICKTPVSKVIAVCPQRDFAFHFHLKQEVPIKDYLYLQKKKMIHARFQEVFRYHYKDAYEYVLKKVYEGATKEAAAAQPAKFEIELEMLHNDPYLDSKPNNQHAISFIEKCLDLCGRYTTKSHTPEKLTMVFLTGDVDDEGLKEEATKLVKKTRKAKKEDEEDNDEIIRKKKLIKTKKNGRT